jgi:NADH-quinone oxidoreductase subunit N
LAVVGLISRLIFGPFYELYSYWLPVVFVMAAGSMIFGALAAYNQRGFKRFLAYSAIGHVGYLLIGFTCATLSGVQGILV